MDESKVAIAYSQRYTINYYRRMVVTLILQQCRVTKVSNSVLTVLCNIFDQTISHCLHTISLHPPERNIPVFSGFECILIKLSKSFMSTTPTDFVLQQYIDYLISHNRINSSEYLASFFGQRHANSNSNNSNNSNAVTIFPRANIEVIE